MFWLNFYQTAYIAELYSFTVTLSGSARAESNTESGIFTNILHSNSFVRTESMSEFKVNIKIQCVLLV